MIPHHSTMSSNNNALETPNVDAETVDRLSSALAFCEQPSICCHGDVQLAQPAIVYYRSQAGSTLGALQLPPKKHAALRPLLAACVPASFGRGKKEGAWVTLQCDFHAALLRPALCSVPPIARDTCPFQALAAPTPTFRL
jgi:hypothetical protein